MSHTKTINEVQNMGDTVIIPVGSLEQHSHHLPMNTDIILTQAFADRMGEYLQAYVLPCLPISTAYEHNGKKGSVWMSADVFFNMLFDIVTNLKNQGYRKVVIIKGHGGIFVMDPLVRHANFTYNPELMVCMLEPAVPESLDIMEEKNDVHAGEYETSLMLYLHPELVKMDLAVDFIPDVPRKFLQYGSIFKYSPDGVWGRPTLATAEKGKLCFEAVVKESAGYVNKIFDMMDGRGY